MEENKELIEEKTERIDMDNEGNKVIMWLKKNVANIFLIGLSIYFIFNGSIAFVPNEMHLWEKIVYIFTTMIFGLVITSLVGESGYTAGKESELYLCTRTEAIECCEKALPLRKEAELYVSKKIDKDIKEERIEILAKASINYSEVFNTDDVPLPLKTLKKEFNKKQIKAVKQAIRIKKIPFALFGFTSVKSVGRKQAPSESKRRKTKFTTGFITKAVMAIASGSVAVSFLGISWSSIIYSLFQLMLWFGSGLIARTANYNFIVNNVRDYDQERIWYLKEFMALPQDEKEKLKAEVSAQEAERQGVKRLPWNGQEQTQQTNN